MRAQASSLRAASVIPALKRCSLYLTSNVREEFRMYCLGRWASCRPWWMQIALLWRFHIVVPWHIIVFHPSCICSRNAVSRKLSWMPGQWIYEVISKRWDAVKDPRLRPNNHITAIHFECTCPNDKKGKGSVTGILCPRKFVHSCSPSLDR